MADERFRIGIKAPGSVDKPQRQTIALTGELWTIEWSTSSSVSMGIDFFNITVGKLLKTADDEKKVEEYWRITRIPGHDRKIRYGGRLPDATSTEAKSLDEGIYLVKISAMASLTVDLDVEAGTGIAVLRMVTGDDTAETLAAAKKSKPDPAAPVTITNETVKHLMDLLDPGDESDA